MGLHATAGVLGEAALAFAEENRSLEAQIELRDIFLEFMDLASTLYYRAVVEMLKIEAGEGARRAIFH